MPLTTSSGHWRRPAFLLLAGFCLLCGWVTAVAASGAYRVELLVFRHESGDSVATEVERISDYPGAWRLFAPRAVAIPEDPAPLGVMSDRMRGVWRRLESDETYTPLYFQTWEQSRIDYHPPIRVHNDDVLLQRLVWPAKRVYVDLSADDLLAPYRHRYYRLDGTVQLRHTRFLHLDIDLQYRVQLRGGTSPGVPLAAGGALSGLQMEPGEPQSESPAGVETNTSLPPGALLQAIRESRQIRTGNLVYFDSPYLGVLARVTETAGE